MKIAPEITSGMSKSPPSSQSQLNKSANMVRKLPAYHLDAGQVWYITHCKPNCEQVALRNLKNQDFNTFFPLQKLTRRNGTGFKMTARPLFPGYIFVALDPVAGPWRKINNTRGVARLVCFAEAPTPVPSVIMEQLFAHCDATGIFNQSASLNIGDDAKITQGPFAGTIGKITEIDPDQRVNLIFDFMGQKSTLTIDSASVISTR